MTNFLKNYAAFPQKYLSTVFQKRAFLKGFVKDSNKDEGLVPKKRLLKWLFPGESLKSLRVSVSFFFFLS